MPFVIWQVGHAGKRRMCLAANLFMPGVRPIEIFVIHIIIKNAPACN